MATSHESAEEVSPLRKPLLEPRTAFTPARKVLAAGGVILLIVSGCAGPSEKAASTVLAARMATITAESVSSTDGYYVTVNPSLVEIVPFVTPKPGQTTLVKAGTASIPWASGMTAEQAIIAAENPTPTPWPTMASGIFTFPTPTPDPRCPDATPVPFPTTFQEATHIHWCGVYYNGQTVDIVVSGPLYDGSYSLSPTIGVQFPYAKSLTDYPRNYPEPNFSPADTTIYELKVYNGRTCWLETLNTAAATQPPTVAPCPTATPTPAGGQ